MAVTDYSKTAADNTSLNGKGVSNATTPSTVDDLVRELMADLAKVNDGTTGLTSPVFGGLVSFATRSAATAGRTGSASFLLIGDLLYKYDVSGTALTTADSRTWSPAGTMAYPDHFADNTTPGTTDMSTAIQAAVDYIGGLGGGEVRFRGEDYSVGSTTITVSNEGVKLKGAGRFTSALRSNSDINVLKFALASPENNNLIGGCALEDITVRCYASNPSAGTGVILDRARQMTIRGVRVLNFWKGISIRGTGETVVVDDVICDSGSNTTVVQTASRGIEIIRREVSSSDPNAIQDATNSLYYTEPNSLYLSNINIRSLGDFGMQDCLYIDSCDGLYMSNIHAGFATNACIHVAPVQANLPLVGILATNIFADPKDTITAYGWHYNSAISSTTCRRHTWVNLECTQPTDHFVLINLADADSIKFSNFVFFDAGKHGMSLVEFDSVDVSHGVIQDVNGDSSTFSHIRVGSGGGETIGKITVRDVRMKGTGYRGIQTSDTIGYINVGDLDISGTSDAPLVFAHSGTTHIGKVQADKDQGEYTYNYGSASISPDANGNGNIAHGLLSTPTIANVTVTGDAAIEAAVQGVGATNIQVRIRNTTTDADVTSGGPYTIMWEARV